MNGHCRYFMLPGVLLLIFSAVICFAKEVEMVDLKITEQHLKEHMEMLTRTIGERSAGKLWNLEKAAGYIMQNMHGSAATGLVLPIRCLC